MAADSTPIGTEWQGAKTFPPSPEFTRNANAHDPQIYARADADPELYWKEWAQRLTWFRPFDTICEWNPPHAKWFLGGQINVSYNCVDRHVEEHGCKAAIIWESEPGEVRTITYRELHLEVQKFANVLKGLGIKQGDRVAIYLPMMPEAAIAMLACTRIGAVHSVIFGGFSADSIRERVNDCGAKVILTADGSWRRGKIVPLKQITDEAVTHCPTIEKVVVLNRLGDAAETTMNPERDLWWHELLAEAAEECLPESLDSEHPLFILYTSGSTGKPKGIFHTTAGYLVGAFSSTNLIFDIKPDDVYWCTADVGWVTGHTYVVYGLLANGATVLMYEGAPDWGTTEQGTEETALPLSHGVQNRARLWEMIERHKVTILYTAPTLIRSCMKWGDEFPAAHDLSSLRLLGSVGEPINPEAWLWYHEHIGGGKCPVVDTWWQTETGSTLISPLPGITTTKPGSATRPLPGIAADIVDEQGNSVENGTKGILVIRKPFPSMLRGIWGDEERYKQVYWSKFDGIYFPGDGAVRDADGDFWLLGRVDDILLVAGHNLSTMEVESTLVEHPAVAEAAVIGKTHEIKGQAPVAFVILREGLAPAQSDKDAQQRLIAELKEWVGKKLGAICRPDDIILTADLPKTRSGKIMRRLLRDVAEGRVLGDTTTLADPAVVASLRDKYASDES